MSAAEQRIEELEHRIRCAREYAAALQQAESNFAKDVYLRHLIDILGEKPAPASECGTCGGGDSWYDSSPSEQQWKPGPCPDCVKE